MKTSEAVVILSRLIPARIPAMLVGGPGVGKTEIVTQVAGSLGYELRIFHPVVSDPTDFKGLGALTERGAEFLPYGELRELIETQAPTVAFFDDLGQAPTAVQAAAMQLVLARRVNGHAISDAVVFVAATNRREDRAGVSGILEPVKSRFVILPVEPDPGDWVDWYLGTGLPVIMAAFIRFRQELLYQPQPSPQIVNTPSPRTVAMAARLYAEFGGQDNSLLYHAVAGAAGEGFATEFLGFLQLYREIPEIDVVLMDPATAPVPDNPAVLYGLATALGRKISPTNIDNAIKYLGRLPGEYQVVAIRDAIRRDPANQYTQGYISWAAKNGGLLA